MARSDTTMARLANPLNAMAERRRDSRYRAADACANCIKYEAGGCVVLRCRVRRNWFCDNYNRLGGGVAK
jgi:hypothetical protein